MKATQIIGNDNVIYTYLPISCDALQTAIYNQNLPLSITSNVLKFPEKNMSFIDIHQNDNMSLNPVEITNLTENTNISSTSENLDTQGTATACIINQESILNKSDLSRKGKDNLKCDTCDKEFDKISNYKKHLLIHRNLKKFKCEHCFESFNIEDNFKLHMALHEQGQPTCPLCKRHFQRLASLKSHLLMHQVEETFVCKECLAEFEKEDEYNRHMNSHNLVKLNLFENIPYICSYCNYLFEDPKDYKEHVSYHIKIKKLVCNPKKTRRRTTNNKEYSHRCSVCDKTFPKNCLLERHMRIHNGEKPYQCTKCDKAFAQKGTLQIHLLKHSGHKPYKCTLCPAEYFQKGNLRVHVEKTHTAPPNIDKMYKCTQCTCIFKKIASLNAHITKAHGGIKHIGELTDINERVRALREMTEQIPKLAKQNTENVLSQYSNTDLVTAEANETFVKLAENSVDGTLRRYVVKQKKIGDTKWFICLYCSKEFKKPSDLIRHIRIHTREKPFKCKTCNQGFALKSTLLSHLNTHDGKREFQCLTCFKFFTSSRTLNVHTRKHNKLGPTSSLKYKCSTCSRLFNTLLKVRTHMEIHNCNNDDIERSSVGEENELLNIPLKQPLVETEKGLVTVPAPKPRIPRADMEEYKHRPYKCHKCNAAFMKPTHVKRHMLTHTGERNFKCNLCSKGFLTSYALKEHLRFHNPEKKFTCTLCPQKFTTKELLKRHQIKHSSLRPYICPYCRRRFKTTALCRRHINIHKNDSFLINLHTELEAVKSNPTKIIDLSDTLSDNPFGLVTPLDDNLFFNSTVNEPQSLGNSTCDMPKPVVKSTAKNRVRSKRTRYKSGSKKLAANDNASVESNHDILNLPNNAQIFISKEGHYTIIVPEANENEVSGINANIEEIDQGPTFVSYDEYQSVNNDVYSTLLSNIKLQNNDPILMSTIGESQDSNILFMDPTLPQTSEFQNETQNFESFNPTIFNTGVDLNLPTQTSGVNGEITQSDQSILSSNRNDIKSNQLKLSFPDSGGIQNITNKKISNIVDHMNLNDNLIITLNGDDFPNMNFNLNAHNGLSTTVDNLNLNIIENEIQNNFTCTICKANFSNEQDLDKHQCIESISAELHDDGTDENLNQIDLNRDLANIQDEQITLITDYHDQLQMTHVEISSDEPSTDVIVLKKTEQNNENYEQRSRTKTPKQNKFENKCSYCRKLFKKSSDLTRHIRTHTGERPFACTKCNKSFSLKSTLQSHLRTHSNTRNKDCICNICHSNYSCQASLKIHMRIHTGVKPYTCQICHMKFRTSSSRKNHAATHAKESKGNEIRNSTKSANRYLESQIEKEHMHSENGQTNEIQRIENSSADLLRQLHSARFLLQENGNDVLDSSFMQFNVDPAVSDNKIVKMTTPVESMNIVNANTLTTSSENPNGEKAKKFECNFCRKTYSTKSVLRKHQKRHKKNFHCTKCDKQFDSQDILDKHVKLHSGYRPFSCTHCANSFSEEGSLKTHMKRIHNVQ